MATIRCPHCQQDVPIANFCGRCGNPISPEQKHIEAGTYLVKFAEMKVDAETRELLMAAADELKLYGKPVPVFSVVLLHEATNASTHRYICSNCWLIVTDDETKPCRHCGNVSWILRTDFAKKAATQAVPQIPDPERNRATQSMPPDAVTQMVEPISLNQQKRKPKATDTAPIEKPAAKAKSSAPKTKPNAATPPPESAATQSHPSIPSMRALIDDAKEKVAGKKKPEH